MKKVTNYLGYTLEFLVCFFLSTTVIITFLQVFYRFVLTNPLSWSQEVLMISFVYFVLFGAALAVKHQEHLKVDLLDRLPRAFKKVLKVVEFLVVFLFIIVFIYFGTILVLDNFRSGQVVGFLPLKVAYVYMAIPISGLFMLYYLIKGVVVK